uniref:Uncharacterized protein n=1 Tax=Anguilla anguilla TaxID=7936 RepID=A0A0E9WZM8_ANGAN
MWSQKKTTQFPPNIYNGIFGNLLNILMQLNSVAKKMCFSPSLRGRKNSLIHMPILATYSNGIFPKIQK